MIQSLPAVRYWQDTVFLQSSGQRVNGINSDRLIQTPRGEILTQLWPQMPGCSSLLHQKWLHARVCCQHFTPRHSLSGSISNPFPSLLFSLPSQQALPDAATSSSTPGSCCLHLFMQLYLAAFFSMQRRLVARNATQMVVCTQLTSGGSSRATHLQPVHMWTLIPHLIIPRSLWQGTN